MQQLQESNPTSSSLPPENLSHRFSLDEILAATNDFNDSLVIGEGGFAKVYKGEIDNGAHTVAIKRIKPMFKEGAPEFRTEILMVSEFRHSHLISLIGYCDSENEMILIYEYMARGTLEDNLHKIGTSGNNNLPLCWVQRLKICIGAARGLEYLHIGTSIQHRVIHRDVKSSNILLDENWVAKISDFGLSKIGPANQSDTHVNTRVVGTFGYLDPDYAFTGILTRKSDVYSFGVVLFEVLCGRPALDPILHEDQPGLAKWAHYCVKKGIVKQIIDPNLKSQIMPRSLLAFVKVADQCLHAHPKGRPTMTEVLADLELALNLQESTKVASGFTEKLRLLFSVTPRPISGSQSLPCLHDKVLAAASDAAFSVSLNQKKQAQSTAPGELFGGLILGLEGGRPYHSVEHNETREIVIAHLESIFSDLSTSIDIDMDLSTSIPDEKDDVDLDIDDIQSDDLPLLSVKITKERRDKEIEKDKFFEGGSTDTQPKMRKTEEIRAKYQKIGDASSAAAHARDKLVKRKEKLEKLSLGTKGLQSGAGNFSSLAGELAKQMQNRKWWQL